MGLSELHQKEFAMHHNSKIGWILYSGESHSFRTDIFETTTYMVHTHPLGNKNPSPEDIWSFLNHVDLSKSADKTLNIMYRAGCNAIKTTDYSLGQVLKWIDDGLFFNVKNFKKFDKVRFIKEQKNFSKEINR